MGSFVREPPVLWAFGGVRADGLRPGVEGNQRFQKSAGCEKSGFKNSPFHTLRRQSGVGFGEGHSPNVMCLRLVVRCSSSNSSSSSSGGGGEFRHKSSEARKNFISKLQFNLIFFSFFFFFRASRFRICSMYLSLSMLQFVDRIVNCHRGPREREREREREDSHFKLLWLGLRFDFSKEGRND